MNRYLIDSSGLWRILRDQSVLERWRQTLADGDFRSCYPQRSEFLRSARNLAEYSKYCAMFDTLYRDIAVPKGAGQWIATNQYRAAELGRHQCLSAVDLQICATAANHGLVIVHDDNDFVTAGRISPEIQQINVHAGPPEQDV